jgi:Uma2 family endonuclease
MDAMNAPSPIVKSPATYQDVLDAPAHMVAEIIHGALHLQPRPAMPHAIASSTLGGELMNPFQKGRGGPGGWWIVDEPELHLEAEIMVPDIAGWRRERMPAPPSGTCVELAPDWVCEVLSPATRTYDLTDKREIYGAQGVRHLWLVDPIARTLEAFERRDGSWMLIAALKHDETVQVAPFEAIAFPLGGLWPDTPETPAPE